MPSHDFSMIEFEQDGVRGVAAVHENRSRKRYAELGAVWNVSLLIRMECAEGGPLTDEEADVLDAIENDLHARWPDPSELHLGRVTFGGLRELIGRNARPEPVVDMLAEYVAAPDVERPMKYAVEHDPDFKMIAVFLRGQS